MDFCSQNPVRNLQMLNGSILKEQKKNKKALVGPDES